MRRALCLALALTAALAGCGENRIKQAQKLVMDGLTDPASAMFKDDSERPQKDGSVAVCGQVNAKNRMGGYVGYRMYIVADGKAEIIGEDNARDFAGRFLEICSTTGKSSS